MKKYDEGYTLPFVLVVFLILSLVATSILTISLRNLQSQKDAVRRMENRYAAQGEIQQVVSRLEAMIETKEVEEKQVDYLLTGVSIIKDVLTNGAQPSAVVFVDEKLEEIKDDKDSVKALTFRLKSTCGSVQIEAAVKITGQIDAESQYSSYHVYDVKIEYDTYTISSVTENGGGNG